MNKNSSGISLEQALRAQSALRNAAGLAPETFPVQAFVGMISDEIEALRRKGNTDAEIARLVNDNSEIEITETQIAENYAGPEQRREPHS